LLLLASTSDKIQVVTTTTANIDVHVSYVDLAAGAATPGRENNKISTAVTTDVVDPPAVSTIRNVKALHIANVHASASNVVAIQHTDGTNVVQLESVTLLAGERISYREGVGMRVIDAAGLEKVNAPINIGQYTIGVLATQFSTSSTTAAKVTGLDMVCGPGTWIFEYWLRVRSSTAGTGHKLSNNHTGTVTAFMATQTSLTTNATDASGTVDQDVTTTPGVVGGLAQRAKSTAAALIWAPGLDATASDNMIKIEGLMVVTVSGNLELYAASETAVATTIETGSVLRVTKAA